MTSPAVAVFCMGEEGHFQRLRPLISGLASRGIRTHVFTDRRFENHVAAVGGDFADLFAGRPLDAADAESQPFPCRFVSFAGSFAQEIIAEVMTVSPSLVIYDAFSVIGRVVATQLGLPHVNVCAGHNVEPARFADTLRTDPRVDVSPSCDRAVSVLRERYG